MKIYLGKRDEYFKSGRYWDELRDDIVPTAEVKGYKEGQKWIMKKLKDIGYKSYYSNINFSREKGWIEIDVGSWSQFFLFYDLSDDEWKEFTCK